jgi:hypothetical protein
VGREGNIEFRESPSAPGFWRNTKRDLSLAQLRIESHRKIRAPDRSSLKKNASVIVFNILSLNIISANAEKVFYNLVLELYLINIIRLTPILSRVYLDANLVVIDFINVRFRGNFLQSNTAKGDSSPTVDCWTEQMKGTSLENS